MNCNCREYPFESHYLLLKFATSTSYLGISALVKPRQIPWHPLAKCSVRNLLVPAYPGQLTLGTWCRMGGRVGPFWCFLGCPIRHNTWCAIYAPSITGGEECLYPARRLSDDKFVVEEYA